MISLNSSAITAYTIILKVASQLRPQRRPPFLKLRSAAYLPEPFIHPLACLAKLLGTGLTTQCRITFSTLSPVMGKTKKSKVWDWWSFLLVLHCCSLSKWMMRVFSGCNSRLNFGNRSRIICSMYRASSAYWVMQIKSSAYLTNWQTPRTLGLIFFSNQRSNT